MRNVVGAAFLAAFLNFAVGVLINYFSVFWDGRYDPKFGPQGTFELGNIVYLVTSLAFLFVYILIAAVAELSDCVFSRASRVRLALYILAPPLIFHAYLITFYR